MILSNDSHCMCVCMCTCLCVSRQFAFPQIELFSFGRDLDISHRLFPPAARCPPLPAASPSLFLLVGLRCCSNWLLYNPLLHASGTFNSLDGKCYLCMNVSAFKICNFFLEYCKCSVCFKLFIDVCVFSRNY